MVDVDSARCDIRGNNDIQTLRAKSRQNALSCCLVQIAVQSVDGKPSLCERVCHFCTAATRSRKHERGAWRACGKDSFEGLGPVTFRNDDVALFNVGGRERFVFDLNFDGIREVCLRNSLDLSRHRCGEEGDLAIIWGRLEDPLDVFEEAHPQHLVRFVQDKHLKPRKVERASLQVIDDPARRPDDDARTFSEGLDLRRVGRAAVDCGDANRKSLRVVLHRGGYLQRELASGGEDESAHVFRAALCEVLHEGESKRCGLSRARSCPTDHIVPLDELRNRLGLNGRRKLESELRNGADDFRSERQVIKADAIFVVLRRVVLRLRSAFTAHWFGARHTTFRGVGNLLGRRLHETGRATLSVFEQGFEVLEGALAGRGFNVRLFFVRLFFLGRHLFVVFVFAGHGLASGVLRARKN